jgi:pantothenate kinase
MNAEKHNLDHIYFGGCFIRGHAATISTLSYAIRFWSKGTKKALFLRHEGYLGAIGELRIDMFSAQELMMPFLQELGLEILKKRMYGDRSWGLYI